MTSVVKGQGFHAEVKGRTLVITIDLDAKAVPSASGKTMVLASSRGNILIEGTDGLTLGLNAYRKR